MLSNFPSLDESYYQYSNAFEEKRAQDDVSKMPEGFAKELLFFNTGPFVKFLSELTDIEDLTCDPYLRGGGIHIIPKNGFLDIHTDFGLHPKLNLFRQLNVLLYFNPSCAPEFGGALELWDKDMKECGAKITPTFNRLVVFKTNAASNHGHPDPWKGSQPRKSLAFYYYSESKPAEPINEKSTTFKSRPGDVISPEKELLREKRSLGRLASNV